MVLLQNAVAVVGRANLGQGPALCYYFFTELRIPGWGQVSRGRFHMSLGNYSETRVIRDPISMGQPWFRKSDYVPTFR